MSMKNAKDILYGVSLISVTGNTNLEVSKLVFDSRLATADSIFVAIPGTKVDGFDFIPAAIATGCRFIVSEKTMDVPSDCTLVCVKDAHQALALMARNFYDAPSEKLNLIGITGTNGKTTTATLLHELFTELGIKSGLLSTVVNKIGTEEIASTHTTPNPVELNALLAKMLEAGCTHCFMEVSSHAIDQKRIAGLHFKGGVFTNITHDHLDYHETFQKYIQAKKGFFDMLPADAFALTNGDDKNGMVMLQNSKAKKYTFALRTPSDFKAKVIENQFSGLVLNLDGTEFWSRLIGDFNAYNLLAVYGVARLLEIDKLELLTALSKLKSVDGRFEYIQSIGGVTGIVDYAHTPDALENVLKTIANIRTKNEQLITVVGCGGDRDKTKRPIMADIASEMSDKVIFTSDNPRSEDPQQIIDEMMEGVSGVHFKKTLSMTDRFQAIKTAVSLAEKGDIILIAGKGHEKYQDIQGVKSDFDDLKILRELFEKLEK